MKKNLISFLLFIAVVLFIAAGYKYRDSNKNIWTTDIMNDINAPSQVLTWSVDQEEDEDISWDTPVEDDLVATGSVLTDDAVIEEEDVQPVEEEEPVEPEPTQPEPTEEPVEEPAAVQQEEPVEVEPTVDENFDPKEFEDEELTELIDMLKTMLE